MNNKTTMRLNVFNSLIGLCVATAAVSCSDALVNDVDSPSVGGEKSDMISFVVAESNNTTRGGSFGNRPCGGAYLHSANGADSLYLNMAVSDITDDLNTRASEITDAAKLSRLNMTCIIRTIGSNYIPYFENAAFTNNNGSVWSSDPAYYWLENETHYKFYGYYTPDKPEERGVEFISGSNENKFAPSIKYTVDPDVDEQFDLSYSAPSNSPNGLENEYISTGEPYVPLDIKHALSKIAFKTGNDMAAGTIKSISITNVYDNGELNLGDGSWKISKESTENFTLSNINYNTAESTDKDITGDTYFMLLPESFTESSEIEVIFEPENGKEDTYSASLRDLPVWEAGKSYTYTITITPESDIVIEELPEAIDAHYVIVKAKVNADNLNGKTWSLEASASDGAKVTMVNEKTGNIDLSKCIVWYEQGYWLDTVKDSSPERSARGDISVSSTDSQYIYIFIPENVTEEDRIIDIIDKDTRKVLASFKQYCPAWNGDLGFERIEDGDYCWGFSWDKDLTVTYQGKYGIIESVVVGFFEILFRNFWKPDYVDSVYKFGTWTVTINFNKIPDPTPKLDDDNGRANTVAIVNYTGINDAQAMMTQLEAWGLTSTDKDKLEVNLVDCAARGCSMKNRYLVDIQHDSNETSYKPVLSDEDIFWFLPAKNQISMMKEVCDDLSGNYWTSTASTTDGKKAFMFPSGSTTCVEELRDTKQHVRAVRDKRDVNTHTKK